MTFRTPYPFAFGQAVTSDVEVLDQPSDTYRLSASIPETGTYKVSLLLSTNLTTASSESGLALNPSNTGGLTINSIFYTLVAPTLPSGQKVDSTSATYYTLGETKDAAIVLEGYVNVTAPGSLGFDVTLFGFPGDVTNITVYAGSGLSVLKVA